MRHMMNRETGYDGIEPAKLRQRFLQVVSHNGDRRIAPKLCAQSLEHRRREIERYELCVRTAGSDQGEQSSSTTAQVQNPMGFLGQEFEERSLALDRKSVV